MPDAARPLVCICIPTYNAGQTITETLTSILGQTYKHLVVKVVDNASTDETLTRVAEFQDSRLQVFRNPMNLGPDGNFDRCIELAEGAYTAIYHADDLYEPEMVEQQVALLEQRQHVGAVFTEAHVIDEHGRIRGRLECPAPARADVLAFATLFKSILKYSNYLVCPSAMIRTPIYQQEIGHWRAELFKSSSDLDVWLRVGLRHDVAVIARPLMNYRVSDQQASHSMIRTRTGRSDFHSVMDFYLKMPEVAATLGAQDLRNYRWLEHTDRAIRATNLVLSDHHGQARELLAPVRWLDALRMGMASTRGLYTMLTVFGLKFAGILRLETIAGWTIQRLRGLIRK